MALNCTSSFTSSLGNNLCLVQFLRRELHAAKGPFTFNSRNARSFVSAIKVFRGCGNVGTDVSIDRSCVTTIVALEATEEEEEDLVSVAIYNTTHVFIHIKKIKNINQQARFVAVAPQKNHKLNVAGR